MVVVVLRWHGLRAPPSLSWRESTGWTRPDMAICRDRGKKKRTQKKGRRKKKNGIIVQEKIIKKCPILK